MTDALETRGQPVDGSVVVVTAKTSGRSAADHGVSFMAINSYRRRM